MSDRRAPGGDRQKGNGMTIEEAQKAVDRWIREVGNGYFKPGDLRHPLSEELADVLWVTLCLANQTGVDLTEALKAGLEKRLTRDRDRFRP